MIGAPVAYAAGQTIFITPTPCHCPITAAARVVAGLALHSRHGFEVVGTIKNAAHKFDRWMDITLVQRYLEA